MSVEQYEAMADAGIFGYRDRVHLINGCLVEKMTQHPPHSIADDLCGEALRLAFSPGWYIRPGKPVRIPGLASMPEPDRSVAQGSIRDYAADIRNQMSLALVVEVSDSSLDDGPEDGRDLRESQGSPSTGSSTWSTARSRSTPTRARPAIGRTRSWRPAMCCG